MLHGAEETIQQGLGLRLAVETALAATQELREQRRQVRRSGGGRCTGGRCAAIGTRAGGGMVVVMAMRSVSSRGRPLRLDRGDVTGIGGSLELGGQVIQECDLAGIGRLCGGSL